MTMRPLILLLATACVAEAQLSERLPDEDTAVDTADTPDVPVDSGTDTPPKDSGTPPVVTDPRLDAAVLVVDEPAAAGVYALADGIPLAGHVEAADGTVLDVTDLVWTLQSDTFTGTQGSFAVDGGVYEVRVGVTLDNGDRLAQTIGGIRVQHPLTGFWVGQVAIATYTELQGQEIRSDCVGPMSFGVDATGKAMEGSGGCRLSLPVGNPVDLAFDLGATITGADVEGQLGLDVFGFSLPVDITGTISTRNGFEGVWDFDATVARFEGEVTADKVNDVAP